MTLPLVLAVVLVVVEGKEEVCVCTHDHMSERERKRERERTQKRSHCGAWNPALRFAYLLRGQKTPADHSCSSSSSRSKCQEGETKEKLAMKGRDTFSLMDQD